MENKLQQLRDEIDEDLVGDILESFEEHVSEADLQKFPELRRKGLKKLRNTHEDEKRYEDALDAQIKFLQKLEADSVSETNLKKLVGALEYLVDPWDVIPDFISEKGIADDIFVIGLVQTQIEAQEN